MLEIAIVGGGLCGVALARSWQAQGRPFALFEARTRLGGRILSLPCPRTGMYADLGPAWFWPGTQPLITRLISELGLANFPQHDEGIVLHLRDPDKNPDQVSGDPVHGGAMRIEGGMGRLIEALAADLTQQNMRLGHVLTHVRDRGDHVELEFRYGDRIVQIAARQAVLAVPPRLLDAHVRFDPGLDADMQGAMRDTETWMAARAKVVIGYDRPLWREAGLAGNAFVTHAQAVADEIFDACDSTSASAALGGFLALTPEQRDSFRVGLPLLMDNQMAQVFGPELEEGAQLYQDWASEPFTCSALDRAAARAGHPGFANPLLRRSLWEGRLYLGGSETSSHGGGYLEGALEAARRIDRAFARARPSPEQDAPGIACNEMTGTEPVSLNILSLGRFRAWVAAQSDPAFDSYRQRLNRSLALQQKDQLTQRAVLGSIEEVFSKALIVLDDLVFDTSGVAVECGRSALTPEIQAPFREMMQALLDDVTAFNRTSCALSNFPDEDHLSKEYMQTILRDVAAAWQEFSLAANMLLVAKAGNAQDSRVSGGSL